MSIIKIRGILVDMLLDIAPGVYGLNVTMDRKVTKQLITQCNNAIYRTMVSILLYYCKFCKKPILNRFKMNPYDPCFSNRLINGLQQSILFHVNYCNFIHKDPKVNGSFIGVLREEYHIFFEDGYSIIQMNCRKVKNI